MRISALVVGLVLAPGLVHVRVQVLDSGRLVEQAVGLASTSKNQKEIIDVPSQNHVCVTRM
jgi:hypothetical protein